MANLTNLPTELHRQIIQDMVTLTEQNWTPRLVHLAGVSPYWNEMILDVVGKRIGELWRRNVDRANEKSRVLKVGGTGFNPHFRSKTRKARERGIFETKRVRRLERVQQKVIMARLRVLGKPF